jgi:4-oxalocrotonate tautomerase
MPYVNVKITQTGVTAAHKRQIVSEITDTLQRVLNRKSEHTHVVIDLVDEEDWGFAGMLTTDWKRAQSRGKQSTSRQSKRKL